MNTLQFQNQPCIELNLASGDRALIALHGAQVLSWHTSDGVERLYLSPKAVFDGRSAIRGGIPICFPQFNQRVLGDRPLPKHGFARSQAWSVLNASDPSKGDAAQVALGLTEAALSPELGHLWPYKLEAVLLVRLERNQLKVTFSVSNTDTRAWPFALALHTYLRVSDIAQTLLHGLKDVRYWDAVKDLKAPDITQLQASEALRFSIETDRVYLGAPAILDLSSTSTSLTIEQSTSFTETVVWNPGAALCAQLADMPLEGYKEMLCVEAALIEQPSNLLPGTSWQGSQMLMVKS